MIRKAKQVTDSEFYMWRTLFAMAHADNVVTKEEIRFMAEVLEDIPFSPAQKDVLTGDIKDPKDIVEMFKSISNPRDQAKFFKFASELAWADGDFGKDEQAILLKLKEVHIRQVNMDELVGTVDLELDDGFSKPVSVKNGNKTARHIVHSFRDTFMKARFRE